MARCGIPAGAALAAALVLAGPAAAELVVFDSDSDNLRRGQVINDGERLELADGESATLISDDGETIRLQGPFGGVPGGGDSGGGGTGRALAGLLGEREASVSFLGATRAINIERPDPWMLDTMRGGDQCIRENVPVTVWRPVVEENTPVSISTGAGAWSITGTWEAGTTTGELPPTMPVRDGGTLRITVGEQSTTITLHVVPDTLTGPAQTAAWMAAAGCCEQARLLARKADLETGD